MAVDDPYDTLAVRRDASLDEIRIVYRRSIDALHPDRLAGASAAMRAHAAHRLSALAGAMEAIELERVAETTGTGMLGPVDLGTLPGPPPTPPPAAAEPEPDLALDGAEPEPAAAPLPGEAVLPEAPEAAWPPEDDDLFAEEPAEEERPAPVPFVRPRLSAPAPLPHEEEEPSLRGRAGLRLLLAGALLVIVVAVAVIAWLNRGGDTPQQRFARPAAPFTFSYPKAWPVRAISRSSALNTPRYQVAVGPTRLSVVVVATFRLAYDVQVDGSAIGRGGVKVSAEEFQRNTDQRLEAVGRQVGMAQQGEPEDTKLGDLDARAYEFARPNGTLHSRFVVAFSGRTQYF